MSNILLAYNNRADAATLAGGAWVASGGVALSNLATKDLGQLARSSSAAVTSTRFRFDLAASRTLRTLGLLNHNLSTAATARLRTGRAVFDVDWASYIAEDRATFSGGAGGTRVNSAGRVASASTPAINHSPVSLAVQGLLLLAQRTNLLPQSRAFNETGSWTTDNTTITANATTSPSGDVDADAMFEAATTSTHGIYSGARSISAGDIIAQSFAIKPNGRTVGMVQVANSAFSSGFRAEFTLTGAGAVSASLAFGSGTFIGATIEAAADGFYTCTVFGQVDGSSTSARAQVFAESAVGTASYLGDAAKGLYLYDAGMVVSTFAAPPIPTTTAAVTRTADSVTVTGSSFTGTHSATAGTLYAEFNLLAATGTQPIVSLDDNTANERIELYVTGTTLKFRVIDGGATQCDITIGTVAANTFYKAAVAWAANDFAGCLSGGTVATDSAGTLPTVDRMRIGADQAGNYQNGHQKRTARFTERLTNAELQTITTSGLDALGYDSGWVNALRFSFIGDTPTAWGEQYPVLFAFDAITARYGTLEINDTANAAGYVQAGRLFVGTGFQPEYNAEYGRQRGRTDLSSSVTSISGKKYSTARRRPRTVDMRFPVLSAAEANHLDEMADAVGTTEEVFYVPDPADLALSQRQGFLAYLRELGALEDSFYENVAVPYRLEEKL